MIMPGMRKPARRRNRGIRPYIHSSIHGCAFSDYKTWADVAHWAAKSFHPEKVTEELYKKIMRIHDERPPTNGEFSVSPIVQDDIRYLGSKMESIPINPPTQLFCPRPTVIARTRRSFSALFSGFRWGDARQCSSAAVFKGCEAFIATRCFLITQLCGSFSMERPIMLM